MVARASLLGSALLMATATTAYGTETSGTPPPKPRPSVAAAAAEDIDCPDELYAHAEPGAAYVCEQDPPRQPPPHPMPRPQPRPRPGPVPVRPAPPITVRALPAPSPAPTARPKPPAVVTHWPRRHIAAAAPKPRQRSLMNVMLLTTVPALIAAAALRPGSRVYGRGD